MTKLTVTGAYTAKDQLKANKANKFIGRGSARSSTAQYAKDYGVFANSGVYEKGDVVFVSAEGARGGRLSIDVMEIQKAASAGVTFVTDDDRNRNRPYNVGEREVAALLTKLGFTDNGTGVWRS